MIIMNDDNDDEIVVVFVVVAIFESISPLSPNTHTHILAMMKEKK